MTARNGLPNKPVEQWWDVIRCDAVFGTGELLERFQAATRKAAEDHAHSHHGPNVLVTLATNARRTEPRRRATDLGNITRRTQR